MREEGGGRGPKTVGEGIYFQGYLSKSYHSALLCPVKPYLCMSPIELLTHQWTKDEYIKPTTDMAEVFKTQ